MHFKTHLLSRNLIALSAATLLATSAMAMGQPEYKAAKDQIAADYKVNQQKCDALSGNAKDVCVKDAKAAHVTAKENAKVAKAAAKPGETATEKAAGVAEARKDAAAEKNEANYKAAKERCDALAGDLKSKSVDDAKRQFGQS